MTSEKIKEADAYLARAKRAAEWGNRYEAEKYYKQAASIAEALVKDAGTVQNLRRLEEIYMDLSWMAQSARQARQAKKWGEKYLAVSQEIYDLAPTPEMKRDLAYAYQNMGDICCLRKNVEETEKYYLICQGMYRELIEETEEKSPAQTEAYRDLATITGLMGHMSRAWKDYRASAERIQESVDLWLRVAQETCLPQDLQKLASYCYNAAIAASERGDQDAAKDFYEKSGNVYKLLGEQTHTAYFMQQAESAFLAAGEISGMQGDSDEEQEYHMKAEDLGISDL